MSNSENLDLKPFESYMLRGENGKSYRGMSVNRHGWITVSVFMKEEMDLIHGGYISFSKKGKRWFVTSDKNKGSFRLTNYEKRTKILQAYLGSYLLEKICSDLKIYTKRKRLYLSIDRIPSNGYSWYELLMENPNKIYS